MSTSFNAIKSANADLARDGFAILRGVIDTQRINAACEALREMIAAVGGSHGRDVNDAVMGLAAQNRPALGKVYDAFRETSAFAAIAGAPALEEIARELIAARHLQAPFQHKVFRIDLPAEHWSAFGWHQDYPYNMLCDRSLTAWTSLTGAGVFNGGVEIAPARHHEIWPVEVRLKRDAAGNLRATRDAFIVERLHKDFTACAVTPELAPGDVVMLHNKCVHRSGSNKGPLPRLSIQARFGDLCAPETTARAWANRRSDGFDTFRELHPDKIEYEEA